MGKPDVTDIKFTDLSNPCPSRNKLSAGHPHRTQLIVYTKDDHQAILTYFYVLFSPSD